MTNDGLVKSLQIPKITTARLTLRPFQLSDAKEVQRQAGHPKVAATTATIPHPYPDGAAEDWISKHQSWFEKGQAVDWAIEFNEDQKLIGCISLGINKANFRAELGYWIGEEHWNRGYCSEAVRAAIEYAFTETQLNKITSRHMFENPASGKVMENAGMVKEGFLRQDFFKDGRFVDMVVYGLLKENWRKRN
jgi:ribosomal-protein-alanine N-acetyltransferase